MSGQAVLLAVSAFFLLAGLFFMAMGVVGILKLPDFYNRVHAASKCTTLGLSGIVIGATVYLSTLPGANVAELVGRAVVLVMFQFVAAPIGAHILGKAALRANTPRLPGTIEEGGKPGGRK